MQSCNDLSNFDFRGMGAPPMKRRYGGRTRAGRPCHERIVSAKRFGAEYQQRENKAASRNSNGPHHA
jgi:hypothetical protein